jgi:hypothetical protein
MVLEKMKPMMKPSSTPMMANKRFSRVIVGAVYRGRGS